MNADYAKEHPDNIEDAAKAASKRAIQAAEYIGNRQAEVENQAADYKTLNRVRPFGGVFGD